MQTWGQFNSGIGIVYLNKTGIGIDKFGIGSFLPKKNLIRKLIYHLIF